MKKTLHWFRNDLRLDDNAALAHAFASSSVMSFVYVHDPRLWRQLSPLAVPRFGMHRRRFLNESLIALRAQLSAQGFALTELWGHPEKILPEVIEAEGLNALSFTKDPAPFEKGIEQELLLSSKQNGFSIDSDWTQFLLVPDTVSHIPQTFTDFRKQVEKQNYESLVPKLQELGAISHLKNKPIFKDVSSATRGGLIPPDKTSESELAHWWLPDDHEKMLLNKTHKPQAPFEKMNLLRGGANAGMQRVHDYLFGSCSVLNYFETRNGLLGVNDSTLFSAWLSNGSLSPRQVFWNVNKFEKQFSANKSTYWVVFELLWREFFKLHLMHSGENFFHPEGFYRVAFEGTEDDAQLSHSFEQILACATGQPFVDANLRELIQTGFMSNRGRQNVASYLMYQMKLPWIHVAAFFEAFLIDYDAASNWGNCAYIAGVSFDPRGGRHFNIEKQQKDYDPSGNYLQAWL